MSNLCNLKQPVEKFWGISISHDLRPAEREERKKLVEAAKLDHADSCDESMENYKFIVVGRGTTQKVVKIKKTELFCLNVTAQSIINKFDLLTATVYDLKPDILGITESWVNVNVLDSELALEGYQVFR